MNAQTQKTSLQGSSGLLEVVQDNPEGPSRGTAVIAHPHPLFGGTLDNKVVKTLARAFTQAGWTAVRFNFRGVGASGGVYDEGRGELEDLLAVVQQTASTGPLALAGFSFGAFVASHAFERLHTQREIDKLILVGTACSRFAVAPIDASAHLKTLVIHGENDDTVPLASVLDWARPQALPVLVVPGAAHFFHGQLGLLRTLAMRHIG